MSNDNKTGVQLIALERARQIALEKWSPNHDDEHTRGELAFAAMCYAKTAAQQVIGFALRKIPSFWWPWHDAGGDNWWKPSEDPIRNLVKAGALIAAEIDRLQRAKEKAAE